MLPWRSSGLQFLSSTAGSCTAHLCLVSLSIRVAMAFICKTYWLDVKAGGRYRMCDPMSFVFSCLEACQGVQAVYAGLRAAKQWDACPWTAGVQSDVPAKGMAFGHPQGRAQSDLWMCGPLALRHAARGLYVAPRLLLPQAVMCVSRWARGCRYVRGDVRSRRDRHQLRLRSWQSATGGQASMGGTSAVSASGLRTSAHFILAQARARKLQLLHGLGNAFPGFHDFETRDFVARLWMLRQMCEQRS